MPTPKLYSRNTLFILIDPDDHDPAATVRNVAQAVKDVNQSFGEVVVREGYLDEYKDSLHYSYSSPVVLFGRDVAGGDIFVQQGSSRTIEQTVKLVPYFNKCMVSGDKRRFLSLILDKDDPAPDETLAMVVEKWRAGDVPVKIGGEPTVTPSVDNSNKGDGPVIATIKTHVGDIVIELLADKAPLTVANFVNLAMRKYYHGLTFHRVISDFMIQGGCPEGTGSRGPGYRFEDETNNGVRHDRGVLSMANAGPNTNGSQFFITRIKAHWLDGKHTVFGKVIAGMDVVDTIKRVTGILSVDISGPVDGVLEKCADRVAEWNKVLDHRFPIN